MEDALQRLADRLARVVNALMQGRTARLSAEADVQSLRAQVTLTSVPPTVDHTALADSVARAAIAAQSASLTEPLDCRGFSKLDKFRSERTRWHDWGTVLQSYISNATADMHTEMTAVEGETAVIPSVAVRALTQWQGASLCTSCSQCWKVLLFTSFRTVDRVKVTNPGGDWS